MNTRISARIRQRALGVSLLEVVLALFILSICAFAMLSATVSSATATRQSAEYTSAVAAARKKMEEICNVPFNQVVQRYGVTPSVGQTFKVYLNENVEYKDSGGVKQRGNELVGFRKVVNGVDNFDAGEIVIITDESKAATQYGFCCTRSSSDGYPDFPSSTKTFAGVNFPGLPMDLNANGNTTDGDCYNLTVKTAVRLPVGVIIRWEGPHGAERYELWNVLTVY